MSSSEGFWPGDPPDDEEEVVSVVEPDAEPIGWPERSHW